MMRLARTDDGLTLALTGGGPAEPTLGVDISNHLPQEGWPGLVAKWESVEPTLRDSVRQVAQSADQQNVRMWESAINIELAPPMVTSANLIFGLGGNFVDHMTRAMKMLGRDVSAEDIWRAKAEGAPPWGFLTTARCVVGSGAVVEPPAGVQWLDCEAEIAAIIRSGGRHLEPDDVRFWGVTGVLDLSIRDDLFGKQRRIDPGPLSWNLGKNFAGAKPMGPAILTDTDVDNVEFACKINGELRQSGNTADMVHGFAETAAYLSRYLDLNPGDVIMSGSPRGTAMEEGPQSSRYLKDGDRIELEVSGVGVLHTVIENHDLGGGWESSTEERP